MPPKKIPEKKKSKKKSSLHQEFRKPQSAHHQTAAEKTPDNSDDSDDDDTTADQPHHQEPGTSQGGRAATPPPTNKWDPAVEDEIENDRLRQEKEQRYQLKTRERKNPTPQKCRQKSTDKEYHTKSTYKDKRLSPATTPATPVVPFARNDTLQLSSDDDAPQPPRKTTKTQLLRENTTEVNPPLADPVIRQLALWFEANPCLWSGLAEDNRDCDYKLQLYEERAQQIPGPPPWTGPMLIKWFKSCRTTFTRFIGTDPVAGGEDRRTANTIRILQSFAFLAPAIFSSCYGICSNVTSESCSARLKPFHKHAHSPRWWARYLLGSFL